MLQDSLCSLTKKSKNAFISFVVKCLAVLKQNDLYISNKNNKKATLMTICWLIQHVVMAGMTLKLIYIINVMML